MYVVYTEHKKKRNTKSDIEFQNNVLLCLHNVFTSLNSK